MYNRNIPKPPVGVTEFEILKASHKFLRDEDDLKPSQAPANEIITDPTGTDTSSWNDQLAAKYYATLYKEFALCDLKHYKSGNFALRWRTEDEVLSGAGETTCGNTRCEHHPSTTQKETKKKKKKMVVSLTTLELPFGYLEHGMSKSALVKVVLCARCLKKLMWKRNKEKGMDVEDIQVKLEEEEIHAGMSKRKRIEEDILDEHQQHDSAPDRLGKRRRSRSRSRPRK